MRFLIVCTIFAYAVAAPGLPVGHRLEPAPPTISVGDINGAVIEAQVEVADKQVEIADNVRAAVDTQQQVYNKVSELQGQAVNAEVEQAWRYVDAVKTVEARQDGATQSQAGAIARYIVRNGGYPGNPYGNLGAYGVAQYAPNSQTAAPIAPIVRPSAPISPVVRPSVSFSPAVQATAPVASVVAPPATYAPAPVASVSAPLDSFLQASAPVTYQVAPIDYSAYPGYSYYSNPYANDFYQGFYNPYGFY